MRKIKSVLILTIILSSFFIFDSRVEASEFSKINRIVFEDNTNLEFANSKNYEIYLADQSHGEITKIIVIYDENFEINNLDQIVTPFSNIDINDGGGTSNIAKNFSNVSWIYRDGLWSLSLSSKLNWNGTFTRVQV